MSICARMDAPRAGALRKRKEREYFSPSSSSEQKQQQKALLPPLPRKPEQLNKPLQLSRFANKPTMPPPPPPPQDGNSKLLAGYLAHEFLRFGTLLGERPPAPTRKGYSAAARPAPAPAPDPARRYAEASTLLMMAGGPRIPGVVNPTQLGQWLRIKE